MSGTRIPIQGPRFPSRAGAAPGEAAAPVQAGAAPGEARAAPGEAGAVPGEATAVPNPADAELARYAKALGHPVRAAILRHLIRYGQCVCGDIVELLPLAQSTVSQHLKVLKEAGLLQGEVDGPRVCYCADPDAVRRLQELIRDL